MENQSRKWFKRNGKTEVMGILNLSKDSFSGDGLGDNVEAVIRRAHEMVSWGVDAIDLGAESTKPGFTLTLIEDDIHLLFPVVTRIKQELPLIPLSIDTYKWQVAEACLLAGADIINDIQGLEDDLMVEVIAKYKAGAVIMHSQKLSRQTPVPEEVYSYLLLQKEKAIEAGIRNILLDPGLGFNKTKEESRELLRQTKFFEDVFIGASRKGFLGGELGERKYRSVGAAVYAASWGARAVRVHDVKETVEALSAFY